MSHVRSRLRASIVGLLPLLVSAVTFGMTALVAPSAAQATTAAGVADYPVPSSYTDPWGTAFEPDGRVWVALPGCDLPNPCYNPTSGLGLFDPKVHRFVSVVSMPESRPLFVAVASDGSVWFTLPLTNSIGVYRPDTQTLKSWTVPTGGAEPWDLAIAPGGKIWFTEHATNQIASFDPGTGAFEEVPTPTGGSDPYGIAVDHDGSVWFTENPDSVAQIGEYSRQGQLFEFKIRNTGTAGTGLTPHLITFDAAGNPWWSEGFACGVGTLNRQAAQPGTNSGVTEYRYSCIGGHTSGIAFHNGNIWFDDSNLNKFGSIPDTSGAFVFYNAPGSHPHDGLNVDNQGRVWFDEEFSNAIAETASTDSSG
jgi:virginiamycin B lyase